MILLRIPFWASVKLSLVFEDEEPEPLQAEAQGERNDPSALAQRLVDSLTRTES